ncbi:hypothetical protein KGF54_000705 [Candida jiufengensis]|uniref:uncharacterized protein n=1 Tax=Candida jiufengensis TaxID=497108 RepID=UPI0022251CA3|nr:uncharacterized protein KGF54_000705 [Candida jiufengensis]KAI5956230.1 hypothetical protein KGF54_000705 [Candida jiufengensis]
MLQDINSKKEFSSILKENSSQSDSNNLIVLDFFDDCTHCSEMNHKLNEISEKYDSISLLSKDRDIKFYKVNIEDDKSLANEYSISSIPTTLFFKKGKLIDKVVGPEPNEIKQVIEDNDLI